MDFKNLDQEANTNVIEKKQNQKPQQPQNMHEHKKVFSFTLRPSLVKKLDIIAKIEDRTRSNMLEKILEKYFAENT
jgi:ATP-dependent protease Clp ATPase subunit